MVLSNIRTAALFVSLSLAIVGLLQIRVLPPVRGPLSELPQVERSLPSDRIGTSSTVSPGGSNSIQSGVLGLTP